MIFEKKTAIVSGAGQGLGKCIAECLSNQGAFVYCLDINQENVQKTASQIHGKAVVMDVSDPSLWCSLIDTVIRERGSLDILINAAGIMISDEFMELDPNNLNKAVQVNVFSVAYSCSYALKQMKTQGYGKIVNIASIAGRNGMEHRPFYSMTKSAVINLTQSAALTGAPYGINVNAVCPGIIRTEMWETILDSIIERTGMERENAWESSLRQRIPMGKAQEHVDIAQAVLFLCSENARYITGQALNVDGGAKMN